MATILIVDDRAICREFLITLLGYKKHRLLEAADGTEALKIIQAEHPDLMITDLLMPTMNGYELVQKIKNDPTLAKLAIIFYTASFLLDEAKLLAETCDVKYVLYKPSEPHVILDTVNDALQSVGALTQEEPTKTISEEVIEEKITTKTIKETKTIQSTPIYLTELSETQENIHSAIKKESQQSQNTKKLDVITTQFKDTFTHLNKITKQLIALSELNLLMLTERDPKSLLKLFCKNARAILGSQFCFLAILDTKSKKQRRSAISGTKESDKKVIILPSKHALIQEILTANEPVRINQIDNALKVDTLTHPPIKHFLGIKLLTPTNDYGYIYFVDKVDGTEFNEVDTQIASTLAKEVALLYENAELFEIIQRHAVRLQLTMHEKDKTPHG